MHTVCETKAFERDAADAGMAENEKDDLISYLSLNPTAGDEIQGTGGCRKLRIGGRGKGKSGGFRVVTFFTGPDLPVFLLAMFSKGERSNLSRAECNELEVLTKELVRAYRKKVVKVKSKGRRP